MDNNDRCLSLCGATEEQLHTHQGIRGYREKWTLKMIKASSTGEGVVRWLNTSPRGGTPLNLIGDVTAVPPVPDLDAAKVCKWNITKAETMDNRKYLTLIDDKKLQLSVADSGNLLLRKGHLPGEQWRLIDASAYPDYPPGYPTSCEAWPGAGQRPLKDGCIYFIVDDFDRCLSSEAETLKTTGQLRGRKEKWLVKVPEDDMAYITSLDGLKLESDRQQALLLGGEGDSRHRWQLPEVPTKDIRRFMITQAGRYLGSVDNGTVEMKCVEEVSAHTGSYVKAQWRFIEVKDEPDYPPGYSDGGTDKPCDFCGFAPQSDWCAAMMEENEALRQKLKDIQKRAAEAKKSLAALDTKNKKKEIDKLRSHVMAKKKDLDAMNKRKKKLAQDKLKEDEFLKKKKKKVVEGLDAEGKQFGNVLEIEVERFGMKCPDPTVHADLKMTWEYLSPDNLWKRFDDETTQTIENGIEDGEDTLKMQVLGEVCYVNIPKRTCTNCANGYTYKIRRRQPNLAYIALMPGAIGAGDKAVKGADLNVGVVRTETLPYEDLLQSTYNLENAGKPPPPRKPKMTQEELKEYWGLDTPVEEGEASRDKLLKELVKIKTKNEAAIQARKHAGETWAKLETEIQELEKFSAEQ